MTGALTFRPIEPHEYDAFVGCFKAAFLEAGSDTDREHTRHLLELERTVAAFDRGQIVGTSATFTQRLSVPGGELGCAGASLVSSLPTHRRRGVLTGMLDRLIHDAREREEPVAALWASEGGIYGRFGFGPATRAARIELDLGRRPVFDRAPADLPIVRLLDSAAGLAAATAIYDRARGQRAGAVTRTEAWWRHHVLADPEDEREGFTAKQVLGAGDGGYAIYRSKADWDGMDSHTLVEVQELVHVTPAAGAALWRYLCGLDLAERLRADFRPPDDPLPLWLANPRHARTSRVHDGLWLRLLDLPAAIAGRAYAAHAELVLELAGDPELAGRWAIDLSPDGADATRTDREPDVSLAARDLASAYLGDRPLASLVAAELAVEHTPGAVARLDAAFAVPLAPWTVEVF